MSRFEWIVAVRYLRAKRRQTVISVITILSILGIAAGVMALIVALAINNGFQNSLQSSLLSATAHVTILERKSQYGIENWAELIPKLRKLPHVIDAQPGLYSQVALKGPATGFSATLKGIPTGDDVTAPPFLKHLQRGRFSDLTNTRGKTPGIILGSRLAEQLGLVLHSPATLLSFQGKLTPFGTIMSPFRFQVVGIFESGLFDLDSTWAVTTLPAAQRVLDLQDTVNTIELRLDDIFRARDVAIEAEKITGTQLIASTWMEQNRSLLNALRLEKYVSIITVGLIELVAALNILVVLVMLVMEKTRDIAILLAMGAKQKQIHRIFVLQGMIIGLVGCALGLVAGYVLSAVLGHYHVIRLDEEVYALSYVPFESHAIDGVWVSALALAVCFVASLHPARTASKIAPAEAIRFE